MFGRRLDVVENGDLAPFIDQLLEVSNYLVAACHKSFDLGSIEVRRQAFPDFVFVEALQALPKAPLALTDFLEWIINFLRGAKTPAAIDQPQTPVRMLLVFALATLVGIAPISASDKDRVPSGTTGERFEGYLFVDVEGHPLPFQSDEEIEEQLRTADVVSVSKIPVGVSRPKKVLLTADSHHFNAVFKFIDETKKNVRDPTTTGRGKFYLEWRDSYIYDVAAYQVDRLMGLDRVPPIVLRTIKGNRGSLQIWLEGTIPDNVRREEAIDPPEIARFNQQSSTMNIFDNLVANRDSNLGNTLIDGNWRLWFIDCSRCFGSSTDLLYPDAVTHCDRRVWDSLRNLDRASAEPTLSPYLSRLEIDALFKRRDKLVELLQERIDEWSEALVLYDQRPPTETAPWVGE